MSTTDTRASFEAHYRKECGMPDSAAFQWDAPYMVAALDGWQAALAWQAATEAAKATGTAGEQTKQSFENIEELPPLPPYVKYALHCLAGEEAKAEAERQMREYGQQCAEAARYDADAAKRLRLVCKLVGIESHVPADDQTLWGAAFAVLGQVRAALEPARQPAPILTEDQKLRLRACIVTGVAFEIVTRSDADAILAATNRSQP